MERRLSKSTDRRPLNELRQLYKRNLEVGEKVDEELFDTIFLR
jgi:hypothetical protein